MPHEAGAGAQGALPKVRLSGEGVPAQGLG